MGMTVGELTGFIDLEDRGFASELQTAGQSLSRLQSTTSSATSSIESTVTKTFSEIEKSIADGLDPTAAIADLDRLEAELDSSLADMLAEADSFGDELNAAIDKAYGDLDDDAKDAGKKAGQALSDGLEDGLSDAERVARKSGEDAGKEFGDGVEQGGGGKGGGGRMSGIASNMIGGLKAGAVGLAASAGAAIGDKLIEGIQMAMERADLFATLSVKVGAFGAESERLGDVAGELYADAYGESLGDVTDALAKVLQNIDGAGQASDTVLKGMTSQAMVVGKTMDEDVGAVTQAVSQILRNDLAPSAEDAFNVLVRGQQEGVNKSEDLLDTFNEYSTIFRDLGLNAEDALGLMSQGLKAGARDSDTVADALKELDIRVKDMSAAPALKALGLNAKEMASAFAKGGPTARKALDQILEKLGAVEDPAKRSQLAVQLFGTKAEDMAKSINSLNLDQAKTSVGGFANAVSTADKTLGDTASGAADKWTRSWDNAFAWMGEEGMTQLQRAFPSPSELEGHWNETTAWFSGTVGPFFSDTWTSVKDKTAEIWDGIGEWLTTKGTEISDTVGQIPTKIGEFFSTGWETVKTSTSEKWEGIKTAATEKADAAVELLKGIPGKIGEFFSTGWNNLKSETSEAWEAIKTSATQKGQDLLTWVQGLPDKIKGYFASVGTWLSQAGSDLIQGMINGVKAKASELANAAKTTVQSAVDGAKDLLGIHSPSTIFHDIGVNTIGGFIGGVIEKGKDLLTSATSVFSGVVATARTTTGTGSGTGGGGQPSTSMAAIGRLTVQGLIQGLTEKGAEAKTTVENLVSQIKEAFASQPDVVDGLLKFVKLGNDNLEDLTKQREYLVDRLAAAKEMAKKVAGTAEEWASITGLKAEDFTGGGDLAQELTNKASAINSFANNIKTLAARGLNKAVIQQIIDSGVEKGASFAEMLVGSDGSEIKALNKAQAAVDKASKKLGKASADAMYDVGKKSGDGYLKGLSDSLKKLDSEMAKIAKSLIASIKKELKIKSPSQVMADIGGMTMQGLANGMAAMTGTVLGTARGVVGAAVAAAHETAGAAAGLNGMGAGLVPGDGYTSPGAGRGAGGFGDSPPGRGGVTVNVEHMQVREEADIGRISADVGFRVMAQGAV